MAIPRVFISSTCYDLKYIRKNLKYFTQTLGYDPVLSEEGSVYYDPQRDTQDSCLAELPSCQLFVLIIGGRFGEAYKDTKASITNAEYREAVKLKIPVFALVDSSVHSDYSVYKTNKDNLDIDEAKIVYPSVDSTKIFDFIEEVRTNSVNNALNPFNDFSDIESYLRQQWAGMMFSFLTRQNEDMRVADTLSALTQMSGKIEFLSNQILKSIGTEEAKLMTELYDLMIDTQCFRALAWLTLKPTPKDILKNKTFKDCAASLGKKLKVKDEGGVLMSQEGTIAPGKFKDDSDEYLKLRKEMLKI
ncbi:unnamed protein product, partial [marine sediment metagenome]